MKKFNLDLMVSVKVEIHQDIADEDLSKHIENQVRAHFSSDDLNLKVDSITRSAQGDIIGLRFKG